MGQVQSDGSDGTQVDGGGSAQSPFDSIPRSDRHGWRVLQVMAHSPASGKGIVPYFSVLTHINSQRLGKEERDLVPLIQENQPTQLTFLNLSTLQSKTVEVTPRRGWGGEGLMGLMIRHDWYENAHLEVIHVLEVHHNSPAEASGLRAHVDFLLGTSRIAFKNYDSLDLFLTQHQDKSGQLLVFNRDTFSVREVTIHPNRNWSTNAGLLGCEVGVGFLHQLPLDGKHEVTYEQEEQGFGQQQQPSPQQHQQSIGFQQPGFVGQPQQFPQQQQQQYQFQSPQQHQQLAQSLPVQQFQQLSVEQSTPPPRSAPAPQPVIVDRKFINPNLFPNLDQQSMISTNPTTGELQLNVIVPDSSQLYSTKVILLPVQTGVKNESLNRTQTAAPTHAQQIQQPAPSQQMQHPPHPAYRPQPYMQPVQPNAFPATLPQQSYQPPPPFSTPPQPVQFQSQQPQQPIQQHQQQPYQNYYSLEQIHQQVAQQAQQHAPAQYQQQQQAAQSQYQSTQSFPPPSTSSYPPPPFQSTTGPIHGMSQTNFYQPPPQPFYPTSIQPVTLPTPNNSGGLP